MQTLVTLWWLCFWTAFGLCLGSFLNAVIYRLPRNRSLLRPLWSACPHCRHRIRWYDNLPVLSFILLRGRCRDCGIPIATHYVVVELSAALIVLMLLDALFIGNVRGGVSVTQFGITEHLALDWPIFMAHVVLFACLLPMSVIDIEHYWVDIRFTNFATIAGFVFHTLWTPRHSAAWFRPWDATAVVSLFTILALAVVWAWSASREDPDADDDDETPAEESQPPPASEPRSYRLPPPSLTAPPRVAGWIAGLVFVVVLLLMFVDEAGLSELEFRHAGRALLPLIMFFALIVAMSTEKRDSDQEIATAIHEERHEARRMVVAELCVFLPAVAAGVLGWWVVAHGGELSAKIGGALDARIHVPGIRMMQSWNPLLGLATAASGFVIAGAVGWAVRIVFTLVFGKEAFGTGDIHLMAAAGCVAGWPVVVLGFFLTCFMAGVGWLVALPFKRTRAVPLGPWLSLSFLVVVVFYDSIIRWPVVVRSVETINWLLTDPPPRLMLEGIR
ncbi:MAG: A24 family peptidase [Phycisphaerae bacterium]